MQTRPAAFLFRDIGLQRVCKRDGCWLKQDVMLQVSIKLMKDLNDLANRDKSIKGHGGVPFSEVPLPLY